MRQTGASAALRAVRGAFAVLSLISCYSMGCAGNEDVDSPVPGIDLGSVVGEQTLGDELVEVAGTLAALLRHEFFMARLSLEALVSAIRISPMSARRFPKTQSRSCRRRLPLGAPRTCWRAPLPSMRRSR